MPRVKLTKAVIDALPTPPSNVVWIGFLGYGFFKLAERAFL